MDTILIIEDIEEVRRWLVGQVRSVFPDALIEGVSTKRQGMNKLEQSAYDLALVDLSLPDGSGIEILRRVQELGLPTLCVVATIHDDDEHLFTALQAGARGYLLKDMSEGDFIERLRRIVNGEPPLSPTIAHRMIDFFSKSATERARLTPREMEVLTVIAKGMTTGETAEMLGLSSHTVSGYVKEIYQKLDISSRAEASLKAFQLGLL